MGLSYHARIPVLYAMIVTAIFISCGTLLSCAYFTQSSMTFSAACLLGCIHIALSCSLR